ncbi:MarR family winged helix-turn-helix transcriptional regulator [Vallitalea okinawensis]|uniref:MarR family winged helix-turn-helix transcriptional regulator n=1 Tax=Vallitalea okinawensis TaxID=2078660 RepID=UPI000CFD44C6|nr:MarR family transcriptional regulator [Vallitalea okinawensis]
MYEKEMKLMTALRKLYKTLDDSLSKNLKELGISTTDYLILAVLEGTGPIPMQKLGDYLLITSGTITYATNRIINKGLVMKIQDNDDKRKFFIKLTDDGYDMLRRVNREHLPYISKVLGSFSGDELDDITETIKKLIISVEKNK